MTRIREANAQDRDAIRNLHRRAFPESERELVATLAVDLLSEDTTPETFALVAEVDGDVAGHIAFSPMTCDVDPDWIGYILGPLGVDPDHQNAGHGSKLVKAGVDRLSGAGVDVLFVYGDPKYYSRFGFSAEAAAAIGYAPPYKLQYPFGWQAIAFREADPASAGTLSCVASLRDARLW